MDEFDLRPWHAGAPGEGWQRLEADDPELEHVWSALEEPAANALPAGDMLIDAGGLASTDAPAVERLLACVREGSYVLYRRSRWRVASVASADRSGPRPFDERALDLSDLSPAPPEPEIRVEPQRPTWIEIAVVDGDGRPITNHPFVLRLSDGSTREGQLGADGVIRYDDVIAGLCRIVFPTVSEDEWDPHA